LTRRTSDYYRGEWLRKWRLPASIAAEDSDDFSADTAEDPSAHGFLSPPVDGSVHGVPAHERDCAIRPRAAGPALLEAANCPAREAGGRTVGCNITLPHEQKPAYTSIDRSRAATSRAKGLLFKYSFAFISLPGSVRTIDELFEALSSSSP